MQATSDYISVPRLADKYDQLIRKIYGSDWRHMDPSEVDGAFGIAICKAIMEGVSSDIQSLSDHFDVSIDWLSASYERLAKNGYMKENRLRNDKGLQNEDVFAWSWMAGVSSGYTGNVY